MKLTNSQWGQSLRSPPILIQVLGLALGTLVVAQIVALILSMIFVPTPRHYALEDIAAALRQTEGTGRDTRFDRHVEPGPPDFSARGWFVSESARRQLAGMMKRPVNQIALGFYTRLPVGGTVDIVPPAQALPADAKRISTSAVEGDADGGWTSTQSLRPAALFVPTSSDLPGLVSDGTTPIGLQQPPGGMPGGGMPGGGFPGGAPGGGMNEGPMGNGFPGRDGMGRTMPRDRGMPDRRSGEVPGGGASSSRPEGTPTARSNRDAVWDQPIRNNGGGRSQGYGPSDPGGSRLGAPQAGASGARDGMAGAPDRAAGPDRAAPRGMGQATPRFDTWSTQPLSSWPVQTQPSRRSGQSTPPITDAPVAAEEASPAPRPALPENDAAAPPPALAAPEGSVAVPAETARARSTQLEAPIGTPVPIQRRPEGLSDWSPAPFVEGDFMAAMRRPDGRWVTVAPRAEGFPNSWQRQLALWFLLSLLLVAPLAWAFARRIVGPLNDFARTADMLGRDPGAAVLPLDGPAEIGRAAHAFNQMQSRLRSFVDDRTAMIGAISHDLRTPLTRLRFRLEDVPDEQREDLLDEVIEMEDMISSVLAFMRDASIPNARERRDLAELVEDVVEDAALIGDVRTARVEPAIVDIDALGMRRVLNNLMTNALKYGGGHARVALHVEDDQAIADIIDQGPGIPPGEVERAFEPFYRSAAAEASGREGSGLGLAVCRSIARAHGGDVELFHSPDGFIARVRLPLAYGLETRAA